MKIIENQTIYKCEHCKKVMFRKCDMSRHEKWCNKAPENKHKCFEYCIHLQKGREVIDEDDFPYGATRRTFTCGVTGQKMYSSIAERRDIVRELYDCVRMPLECKDYHDRIDYFSGELLTDEQIEEIKKEKSKQQIDKINQ